MSDFEKLLALYRDEARAVGYYFGVDDSESARKHYCRHSVNCEDLREKLLELYKGAHSSQVEKAAKDE